MPPTNGKLNGNGNGFKITLRDILTIITLLAVVFSIFFAFADTGADLKVANREIDGLVNATAKLSEIKADRSEVETCVENLQKSVDVLDMRKLDKNVYLESQKNLQATLESINARLKSIDEKIYNFSKLP